MARDWTTHDVRLFNDGFRLSDHRSRLIIEVRWDEVARVDIRKRTPSTIDDTGLWFRCHDGRGVFTSEETTHGFSAMRDAAEQVLGFPADWFGDVKRPQIAASGTNLVQRKDPRAGRTVVIVPGLDGTGHLLTEFVRAAPDGVRPLVVPYHAAHPADIAREVIAKLPPDPVPLVAESYGSLVTAHIVREAPERVSAVAIAGGFCRSPIPRSTALLPLHVLLRLPAPHRLVANRATGGDRAWADRLVALRTCVGIPTLAARIRAIAEADLADFWSGFEKPALIMHGSRDRTVPRRCADELAQVLPHARRIDLDAPHLMLEMDPHEAWAALNSL